MRIIGGALRGRRLIAPSGHATRPTAERVRQALFDGLRHASWGGPALFEGARVLDAFAGTGALGLEALSRGAAHATFLDTDRDALQSLRRNVSACRLDAVCAVIAADATRPPRAGAPCDLVFLDPPYGRDLAGPAADALAAAGWIARGALIVVETPVQHLPPPSFGPALWQRDHGAARVSVCRWQPARPA